MLLGGIHYLPPAIEAAHKHGIYGITDKIVGLSYNGLFLYLKPIFVLTISIMMALIFNMIMSSYKVRNNKFL